MNQFIFKSRWIAISFAVLMLFSTYMLVGREEDGGTLGVMEDAAIDQRDQTVAQLAEIGTPEGVPEAMDDAEFVDDEELIDGATGEDPSPGEDDGDYSDYSNDPNDGPQFAPQIEVDDGGDAVEHNGDE